MSPVFRCVGKDVHAIAVMQECQKACAARGTVTATSSRLRRSAPVLTHTHANPHANPPAPGWGAIRPLTHTLAHLHQVGVRHRRRHRHLQRVTQQRPLPPRRPPRRLRVVGVKRDVAIHSSKPAAAWTESVCAHCTVCSML